MRMIMISEEYFENATLVQDCENPNKFYLCGLGRRHIFEDGKYVGWYNPELSKVV